MMKNHKALKKIIAPIFLVALLVPLLNFVLHSTTLSASLGSRLENLVLCSSYSLPGLPLEGHYILMDTKTGEIWAYREAALIGKAQPVYLGTLPALGKPALKKKELLHTDTKTNTGQTLKCKISISRYDQLTMNLT